MPGYCKYCCNEHCDACIILNYILLDSKMDQCLEKTGGGALTMVCHLLVDAVESIDFPSYYEEINFHLFVCLF